MKSLRSIPLILRVYGIVLCIFSLFRMILFSTEFHRINLQIDPISTILHAFFIGIRFDIVISGYIIILPALILLVVDIFDLHSKVIKTFIFGWLYSFFMVAFAICSADIPYFNQFFSRFSVGAFEWIESPKIMFGVLSQEPKYAVFLIPFLIITWLLYYLLKKTFRLQTSNNHPSFIMRTLIAILFLGIIFVGIRGRTTIKSPIRIGTAYFSNNSFLNQLGLNPVFTLMRSYLDSRQKENQIYSFIDDNLALKTVQKQLHITNTTPPYSLSRQVKNDSILSSPNVIIIIMESMSAAKMTRHGNPYHLTPFLDSLSHESIYFENTYTAGKHTFNGIFSTLFSFPALYRKHPLKQIHTYNGISSVLRGHGYTTTYFTTHDGQFDNVEGFLRANDFQQVISQSNYPMIEIKTSLGVPDDYMFRYAIPKLNELHQQGEPFFTTFMTVSDHGPYYIPPYFTPKSKGIKHQIVEYADWSLQQFINLSKKQTWFDNTLFVFVADHGAAITAPYDISLDYHHSPLLFYCPKLIPKPTLYSKLAGQIDVFPSLMSILGLDYINTSMGVNLFDEDRPYTLINDDDKIGVLDLEFLLILKEGVPAKLHKYQDAGRIDYASQYPEKVKEMSAYAFSHLQVYQQVLLDKIKVKQ